MVADKASRPFVPGQVTVGVKDIDLLVDHVLAVLAGGNGRQLGRQLGHLDRAAVPGVGVLGRRRRGAGVVPIDRLLGRREDRHVALRSLEVLFERQVNGRTAAPLLDLPVLLVPLGAAGDARRRGRRAVVGEQLDPAGNSS